jgi:hypothetical protein
VTDAERIAELEEALRQRDARIAELVRMVGRLSKVIEAWKRGHRVRSGGKIAQKPIDKRRASGRGRLRVESSTPGRGEAFRMYRERMPRMDGGALVMRADPTASKGG